MEDGDLSEKVQEEEDGVTSSRAQDIKKCSDSRANWLEFESQKSL